MRAHTRVRPLGGPAAVACAAVAGLLYAAAFPPYGAAALAWVAWIPLLAALPGRSLPGAAGLGLVFGLTLQATLGFWLPGMLQDFFGISPAAAALAHLGHGLWMVGVPYAAACVALAWASRRGGLTPPRVAGAVALAELARTHMPAADPYALIAVSQVDAAPAQIADLLGPFAVGALVAAANAALAGLLVRGLAARPLRGAVATAAVVACAGGYGFWRQGQAFDDGPTFRAAVVQPAIPADRRKAPAWRRANLELQLELSRRAEDPDLVFWPEYAIDFYLREPSPERDVLLAGTRELGAELVLGGPHWRHATPQRQYYTSVFLLRDGAYAGRYDKLHLVPFAESSPFAGWLTRSSGPYWPGFAPYVLSAEKATIGAFLCGEAMFPSGARRLALAGAELLANPSNDDWLGHPAPAEHQVAAARLRAIENRRWLVRPTVSGISAVVDPAGRVLARGGFGTSALLEASVHARRERTLYQRWGDAPVLAFVLLVGTVTSIGGRPGRIRHAETGGWRR